VAYFQSNKVTYKLLVFLIICCCIHVIFVACVYQSEVNVEVSADNADAGSSLVIAGYSVSVSISNCLHVFLKI